MHKISLASKFAAFSDHWSPKIVADLNDSHVKLAKLKGEFIWHHHQHEDELFFVVCGTLRMKFREAGVEREVAMGPGEMIVVPRGTEHLPIADEEVHLMLIEPNTTLNTGNLVNERTVAELERI